MNRWKKYLLGGLCGVLIASMVGGTGSLTVRAEEEVTGGGSGTTTGTYSGSEELSSGEMLPGNAADVSLSDISTSFSKSGGKAQVSFTVTGNTNAKKKYSIDKIERVYPVADDSSSFVGDNEMYRVTYGTGNTLSCSYTFQAKDNVETGSYPAGFVIVYSRKSTDGSKNYDNEYYVNKSISLKVMGKTVVTEAPATAEPTAKDDEVYLRMGTTPTGTYGGNCRIQFAACSKDYKITSVVPVINENFPFESTSDAYKVVRSKGSKALDCSYLFKVKNNVTTGYQGVTFKITYLKKNTSVTTEKTVNVELQGKKEKKGSSAGKKSTPRVMVIGYTTDVDKIQPGDTFKLSLKIKNNAPKTVYNVKFTLSTENGEFLPISGASTAYLDSIGAKNIVTLPFEMKASSGLASKSYVVKVKSEYEDGDAEGYSAGDDVSVPVVLPDRISLSDIMPPDMLCVGGMGDMSLSINNQGNGNLNNVTVQCKGEDFTGEEAYVGNIAAGATGYATVPLTGTQVTPEDSDGSCTIVVKYENASGEKKKYKESTYVYVMEEMDESEMWGDEEIYEEESKPSIPLAAKIAIVVVVVIIVIIVVRCILKKRRLKKEEELMDDELL